MIETCTADESFTREEGNEGGLGMEKQKGGLPSVEWSSLPQNRYHDLLQSPQASTPSYLSVSVSVNNSVSVGVSDSISVSASAKASVTIFCDRHTGKATLILH